MASTGGGAPGGGAGGGGPTAGAATGAAGGDVSNIANSPAYAHLDTLVSQSMLTDAQASMHKAKYAKLHDVVLRTYDHEKTLLKRAKQLNQDLLAEKMKLDKQTARAQEDSDTIASLRDELSKGQAELAAREEKETSLQLEADSLVRQKTELEREAAANERMQAELLQPQIDALERAVGDASTELHRQQAALTRLQGERRELNERTSACRAAKHDAEAEKGSLNATFVKVRSEPDKLKKQADAVLGAAQAVEADVGKLAQTVGMLDGEVALQSRRRKELDEQRTEHAMAAERSRAQADTKQREIDSLSKRIELARAETQGALTERVRLEVEQKAVMLELKREQDGLNRRVKEYNVALKRARRAEVSMHGAQGLLPHARLQLDEAHRQLGSKRDEKRRQLEAIEEMRREVDIFINNFLKQEDSEQDQLLWLQQLHAEVGEHQAELKALGDADKGLYARIAELNAAREAKSREVAKTLQQTRDANEELKVRQLALLDLSKKLSETKTRLAEFSKLYDVVKNERNKYVHLIQESAQALAEMKEKIKILQNEVDILRRESAQKDAFFSKEHLEHQSSTYARDALRIELNKAAATLSERQGVLKQQAEEVRNLNAIISTIEREMLRLKRQYELAIDDRNYTGVQLIDRNDELCILYEKSNVQQGTLTRGELQLQQRNEEVRVLDLELARLVREVEAVRRVVPKMPSFEERLHALQEELEAERARTAALSSKLEAPTQDRRWRRLEGRDAEPEDLAAKIALLDERLTDKKEQLLEKELVLEEVTNLAAKLRAHAIERRDGTLELAKGVNDVQARLKATTRKMMAAVSELSMYQASAMKLTHDNTAASQELDGMRERLQQGQPPSDEVELEWQRYSFTLDRKADETVAAAAAAAAGMGDSVARDGAMVATSAEPRPNAYIPDDLGIPKPYGQLAPFKPTEAGSTMRHIRRPVQREIDI